MGTEGHYLTWEQGLSLDLRGPLQATDFSSGLKREWTGMCTPEVSQGLEAVAQLEKGAHLSQRGSALVQLSAWPEDRRTQREKSQTCLPCKGQGSGMHPGDKQKTSPPSTSDPNQGTFM